MKLKYNFSLILFCLSFLLVFSSCGSDAEQEREIADESLATEDTKPNILVDMNQTLTIHPGRSNILWTGKKITGKHHLGNLKVASGQLVVADGKITGGNVEIDMSTINVLNEEGTSKERLETHLKSADFFEISTYPTATFNNITARPAADGESGTHVVSGELTMKGNTHPVSFPANLRFRGESVQAKSLQFTVDRSLWDVKYGSTAFFANLSADNVIEDNIQLVINLYAD